MNSQITKRKNPFETASKDVEVEKITEEPAEEVETYVEEEYFEEPKPVQRPQTRQQPTQRPVRTSNRQQYYQPDDINREKYTSTMDVNLRRQIKIVCATRGIMFAKFVEDACREKLAKEGVR